MVGVVAPTLEEVARYEIDMAESEDEDEDEDSNSDVKVVQPTDVSQTNGNVSDADSDIMIVEEVSPNGKNVNNSLKTEKVKKDKFSKEAIQAKMAEIDVKGDEYPPYGTVKYYVEEIDPWDYKNCQVNFIYLFIFLVLYGVIWLIIYSTRIAFNCIIVRGWIWVFKSRTILELINL